MNKKRRLEMSSKQQQQLISEASSSTSGQTVQEMNVERDSETEQRIGQVFRTMLFFTTLMVLGPILTYFYSRTYIFESILYEIKLNLSV